LDGWREGFRSLVAAGVGLTVFAADVAAGPRLKAVGESGEIRAVIVGIDKYRNTQIAPELGGAVADALDISGTLKRNGVSDITVLLDAQATRAALSSAVGRLAGRTRAEDLVIVSFAGHGSQDAERRAGSEPDGLDEYFLLSGFDMTAEGLRERVIDDEMFGWLGAIAKTGASVLFVADACFGGGLVKAPDARAGRPKFRSVNRVLNPELAGPGSYYIPPGLAVVDEAVKATDADSATRSIASLTFVAAVDDATQAPELSIPGEATTRGAASYVLARALEGQADLAGDGDGVTTRHELATFLRRHVRILSQDLQTPVVEPSTAAASRFPLFRNIGDPPKVQEVGTLPPPPTIVAVEALSSKAPAGPSSAQDQLSAKAAQSDYFWDPRTGDVVSATGVVLAYGVMRADLPVIEQRIATFYRLAALAAPRGLDMTLSPEHRDLGAGERLSVTVSPIYGRFVTVLNLTGNGTLEVLVPYSEATDDRLGLTLTIGPPFGIDTLIVIAAKRRLPSLELALAELARRLHPLDLPRVLEQHLAPADRIGIASYTTRPGQARR
jgi:hypothetical protein